MNWRPYGRDAVLIQFAERPNEAALQKRLRIMRALSVKSPPLVIEFVPGFTSLLVEFDLSGGASLAELAEEAIRYLEAHAKEKVAAGAIKSIPVNYDGIDLQRVADCNGLTVEKVIQYHSGAVYKVQLLGFSPGFPYLGELAPKLHTPRLAAPRARVEAGSVALGGEHTGIYTVESPGGWNIIGRTEVKIFDLSSRTAEAEEQAFMLQPGDRVKFVPTGAGR
jgi:KipI family sensor histidine kinase inhibitor